MILYPDPGIESSVLAGHEDSVWGLTYSAVHHRLASCSADGTIRIWDPQNSSPCMSVFNKERGRHLSWLCGFALALFLFRSHILITFHCLFGFLCVCVCISFIYLFIFPRARNTHLSGVCSHWSQPGGGVIWWRWDPPVWPQHRAECHYARYTDQRWYVLDTVSNIMCNTFFFVVVATNNNLVKNH